MSTIPTVTPLLQRNSDCQRRCNSLDLFEILLRALEVSVTVALVYYAYATIREAKRNRKKDTIEKMLENLYSPLRELLITTQSAERDTIRMVPYTGVSRYYVFSNQEFEQVHELIAKYGHYLESDELLKLRKALVQYQRNVPEYRTDTEPLTWYHFNPNYLDPHREHIEKKHEQLIRELRELTET